MRINTNLIAQNTYIQYTKNNNSIASSVEKLSSGYAINSASDNAAGLAISEKMRAQIRGLDQASSNSQDAISLVQTAEGSLSESTQILQRMREISVQSSSDTNGDSIDREALQDEFSQLQSELDDISSTTTYNKKNLLDGSLASSTKSLSNVKLGNSSLAVSLGSVSSGSYQFSVSKQLESAAVASADATGSAAMGTKATATFSTASVTAVPGGQDTALLNGNYTLSTTYDSKSTTLTVTATGDNGKTFTANVDSTTLNTLAGSTGTLTLNFASSEGAGDGFTLALNTSDKISTSDNGLKALAEAVDDTTVSVAGGVDAKAATYGIYASMTGADSVKLNAGDTSVTFSNGATVSFNALTATNLDTNPSDATYKLTAANTSITWSPELDATDISVTGGDKDTQSTFSVDTKDLFGGSYTAGDAVTAGTVYNLNVGGTKLTYTAQAGDTESDVVAGLTDGGGGAGTATAAIEFASTSHTVTFTAAQSTTTSTIVFSGDDDGGADPDDVNTGITEKVAVSGNTNIASTFSLDIASLFGGSYTSGAAVTKGVDYNVSLGGNTYTYTAKDGDTQDTVVDSLFSKIGSTITADTSTGSTITFTASQDAGTGSIINFTGNDTAGESNGASAATIATSGTAGSIYNFNDIFGDGTFNSSKSTFDVTSEDNAGLTFQVGANEGDEMVINIDAMNSQTLGINSAKVSTQDAASAAIDAVDAAINTVSSQRAYLGAIENRLTYKIDNLDTSSENLTSAESQIRDVDMAKEMTSFTNANILQQAATAMLAQANSLPQNVLSLLK